MSTIYQEFIEGFISGIEYVNEKQLKLAEKIVKYFKTGSAIKSITRMLTIVLIFVWMIYIYYMFFNDIYNKGILFAIDNQFYINRYYFPILGLLYILCISISLFKKE
jgi:hypothetical protein